MNRLIFNCRITTNMILLRCLLILSTYDLVCMFSDQGRFIYVNKNLTFEEAWSRCHETYNGRLAPLEKWTHFSRSLQFPCFETKHFFWHGSLIKMLPWISFEGCHSYGSFAKSFIMPRNSLAWCQTQCILPTGSYFGVNGSMCMCTVDIKSVKQADIRQCNITCEEEGAMCGGNGYINLYKVVRPIFNFDHTTDTDKRCIAFKCASDTTIEYEALNCMTNQAYICENKTDRQRIELWKPWLTSNTLCTNMFKAVTVDAFTPWNCKNIKTHRNIKRWTSVFRVEYKIEDKVNVTLVEMKNTLNTEKNRSYVYTSNGEGMDILLSKEHKEYPSLCETGISGEKLIEDDRVCGTSTSTTEERRVQSTEPSVETTGTTTDDSSLHMNSASTGYEYYVIAGAFLVVLVIVVALVDVYHRITNKRNQMENRLDMQHRTIQEDVNVNISPSPTQMGNTPSCSGAAQVINSVRCDTGNVCKMGNGDNNSANTRRQVPREESEHVTTGEYKVEGQNGDNDLSSGHIDTLYNEIGESSVAEIETRNLASSSYGNDDVYMEIGLERNESVTRNSDPSVFSEVPEGVYDILNATESRLKRNETKNVYGIV